MTIKHISQYIALIIAPAMLCCSCAEPVDSSSSESLAQSLAQEPSEPKEPEFYLPVREGISPITGKKREPTGKRPLAVMVDNVRIALPQRGLADADILYEMLTEGGITRLMAVYEDYENMPEVGPVRSARDQHVQMLLPYGSLFLHVGSSTYAADLLEQFHYQKSSVNGYYQPGALQLDAARNNTSSIEHCWFTNGQLFSAAAKQYGIGTDGSAACSVFDFANEERELTGEPAENIQIRFSSYANTSLDYNTQKGKYEKSQFDLAQIDENTGEVIAFDNVIVLFTDITKYPDRVLAKVDYRYGGLGYYAYKGKSEPIRWIKGDAGSPLRIVSPDGREESVQINPGTTYVAVVDLGKYQYFSLNSGADTSSHGEFEYVEGEGETESPDTQ